ncbi:hypothetical protein E2C01_069073 [Portunus trituberculatus]|uniref:Uncharacterized protein n=1 Tax=Portunus trituberculatus TaxID=210409 RepID=A0A5B7HYE6_PORTR|nr:hypothetical protein [Portunus trituberculatus]
MHTLPPCLTKPGCRVAIHYLTTHPLTIRPTGTQPRHSRHPHLASMPPTTRHANRLTCKAKNTLHIHLKNITLKNCSVP